MRGQVSQERTAIRSTKAMVDKPWGIDGEGYFKIFVNGLHDRIEKRLKRNRRKPLVHSASRANQSLQK